MGNDRKYNVLMIAACPFPANHGSAASIREMSEALVKLGHTVHVVAYPIQENIPISGVHIHRVNFPFMKPGKVKVGPGVEKFFYDPLMILKSIQLIFKFKIDVIHAHNYEAALIGWFGKVFSGRPMLYNAVTSMEDELPTYNFIKPRKLAVWLGRLLDSLVPRSGNVVTVVSDALKDFLILKGVAESRIRVVPAGVNLEMFKGGDAAKVRARHGLENVPLVMYTGALEAFQRIDYLMLAMRQVAQSRPDAHLVMVGSVPNRSAREKYEAMARELGISDNVTFIDVVSLEELPDYLAAADVTVVPRPECPGHPVKLLNYMAAGKAIVSFEGGAKGLHHMHNGYLVADHDAEELGNGIVFLLENIDIREALGARAYASINGSFDWETLAKGIAVMYGLMLEKHDDFRYFPMLNKYIRDGYILRYVDRRDSDEDDSQTCIRSGKERRKMHTQIMTLERRKLDFTDASKRKSSFNEGAKNSNIDQGI